MLLLWEKTPWNFFAKAYSKHMEATNWTESLKFGFLHNLIYSLDFQNFVSKQWWLAAKGPPLARWRAQCTYEPVSYKNMCVLIKVWFQLGRVFKQILRGPPGISPVGQHSPAYSQCVFLNLYGGWSTTSTVIEWLVTVDNSWFRFHYLLIWNISSIGRCESYGFWYCEWKEFFAEANSLTAVL